MAKEVPVPPGALEVLRDKAVPTAAAVAERDPERAELLGSAARASVASVTRVARELAARDKVESAVQDLVAQARAASAAEAQSLARGAADAVAQPEAGRLEVAALVGAE